MSEITTEPQTIPETTTQEKPVEVSESHASQAEETLQPIVIKESEVTLKKNPTEDSDPIDDDKLFEEDDKPTENKKKRRLNKVIGNDDDDDDDDDNNNTEKPPNKNFDDFNPFAVREVNTEDSDDRNETNEAEPEQEQEPKKKKSKHDKQHQHKKRREKGDLKEDEYDESGMSISTETGKAHRSKKDVDATMGERAREIITLMEEAFDSDVKSVKEHKPPFEMIKKFDEVQSVLSNCKAFRHLAEGGVYAAIAKWLTPIKSTLPLAETRGRLIDLSLGIVKGRDINTSAFKESGLTKRIYYLYKNDTNPANRERAKKFIDYVSEAIIRRR